MKAPLSAHGYLLVRGGGVLFGVANAAVGNLTRGAGGFRLELDGGALTVDEILGVVAELPVWPVAAALRRFWPESAGGLAVHAEQPLVVVDPAHPPRMLCAPAGPGDGDGQGVGRDA